MFFFYFEKWFGKPHAHGEHFKYLIWLIFWKSKTLSQSWCNANPATRGSWECIHKHWTPSSNAVPAGRFPLVLLYSYFLSNCCPLMRVLTFLRPLPSPFRTQFSDLVELLLGPLTEFMVQQTHALDWGSPMLCAINVMLYSASVSIWFVRRLHSVQKSAQKSNFTTLPNE